MIEDDENLALLLRYNLEAAGYAVETLTSGPAADTRLATHALDLVILDWGLPGLSGIEVLRKLRSRGGGTYVPVIMLTARGERESRLRALATGADVFMSKPFSISQLISQVERLLRVE